MKTHRETYPEQYAHPLVGKRVRVRPRGPSTEAIAEGVVERVVTSPRWGQLAHLEGDAKSFWAVAALEVCPPQAYSVRPFGGADYSRNAARCRDGATPCAICGRSVKDTSKAVFAVVVDGGAAWGDAQSYTRDPGYMGGFPVGPDCHRKYRVKG